MSVVPEITATTSNLLMLGQKGCCGGAGSSGPCVKYSLRNGHDSQVATD